MSQQQESPAVVEVVVPATRPVRRVKVRRIANGTTNGISRLSRKINDQLGGKRQ